MLSLLPILLTLLNEFLLIIVSIKYFASVRGVSNMNLSFNKLYNYLRTYLHLYISIHLKLVIVFIAISNSKLSNKLLNHNLNEQLLPLHFAFIFKLPSQWIERLNLLRITLPICSCVNGKKYPRFLDDYKTMNYFGTLVHIQELVRLFEFNDYVTPSPKWKVFIVWQLCRFECLYVAP